MIYEEKELRFKLWQMQDLQNKILQKCTIKYDVATSSELKENQVSTYIFNEAFEPIGLKLRELISVSVA